jgi:hypothetical protein
MSLPAVVVVLAFLAGPIAIALCRLVDWYYGVPPPPRRPRRWWKP